MAKKYIDADYLRKEIKWRLSYIETATGDYAEGRRCELRYLLSIIDVPRQEQPDDICKEGKVECSPIMREFLNKFIEIGNTFNFGFGPKDIHQEKQEVNYKVEERKWVYDAVDNIFPEDGDFMSEVDFRKIIKATARHFYELGLNARKEE